MKKIILIVFLVFFLVSCGPRRMGCGPRSCSVSAKQIFDQTRKNETLENLLKGLIVKNGW